MIKWLVGVFVLLTIASGCLVAGFADGVPQYGVTQALFRGSPAPVGVAVDALGAVYWANWDAGQLLAMPKGALSPIVLLSGLDHPSGIAVDMSGNVYYTEYLLKTVSILPAGSKTPSLLFRAQNYPPFISLDDAGNVYYIEGETCNGRGSNKIVKYDSTLKTLTTILGGQGSNPWFGSVYIHRSGDLYYTACGSGSVERLPKESSTPEVLVRGLDWPNGIRADIDGNVFYTEYSRGVSMLAKGATTPVTIATEGGTHYELALDNDGNLYYSDNLGGTIWKIPKIPVLPKTQQVPVSTPELVDSQGSRLTTIQIGQLATVQARVRNNDTVSHTFTYIVQVKNSTGVIDSLAWIRDLPLLSGASASPGLSWRPSKAGTYVIEVYVWENLNNQVPLSTVGRITVTVR